MSRVAKSPIPLPPGVAVSIDGDRVEIKGSKGTLVHIVHPDVAVKESDGRVSVSLASEGRDSWAHAGTTRALLNNLVVGVSSGFEKKLSLVGVGYRASVKGNVLNLSLGFSHPVDYAIPDGISIETPSATEVVVKGVDKQKVGQIAAEIRSYRPPEPYKGKGVRYVGERVQLKEAKKK